MTSDEQLKKMLSLLQEAGSLRKIDARKRGVENPRLQVARLRSRGYDISIAWGNIYELKDKQEEAI